ncbi:MAG: hypothetical protein WCJ29_05960 [bacterium]
MKIFYSPDFVASAHTFDTTRKAGWIAASLKEKPLAHVEIQRPRPLSMALLEHVHDLNYVHAVQMGEPRKLAASQGFIWDPGLWTAAISSCAGAVESALVALEEGVAGSLSSGLHHAKHDRGDGFCTFNGLALAVIAALEKGAKRILIIDADAHFGGGTESLVKQHGNKVHHLDVATSIYDAYEPASPHTADLVGSTEEYLPLLEKRLLELDPKFDLCLYNAGMDPHEECFEGGLPGMNAIQLILRENLVFTWCEGHKIPVAFVTAGGYIGGALDEAGLVDLHRITIRTFARLSRK